MSTSRSSIFRAVLSCAVGASLSLLTSCTDGAQSGDAGVSKAEYYAAAQAAAQCINEKGFEATEVQEDPSGLYQVGIGSETAEDEDIEAAYDTCWSKYALPVEDKYVKGLALSGEAWEADYRELVSCLEAAGITSVKVGDEQGVVGEAIGENDAGVMCLQAHLWQLFSEDSNK